jgi:hypothetical protein
MNGISYHPQMPMPRALQIHLISFMLLPSYYNWPFLSSIFLAVVQIPFPSLLPLLLVVTFLWAFHTQPSSVPLHMVYLLILWPPK